MNHAGIIDGKLEGGGREMGGAGGGGEGGREVGEWGRKRGGGEEERGRWEGGGEGRLEERMWVVIRRRGIRTRIWHESWRVGSTEFHFVTA